jgi:exopolyphosphatase/guanosine-5'-triphosphate,3'-diphosphate pyrophosphatase
VRVAAIDVGTNSIHLLVADVDADGQVTVVEKDRSQVMLGSGGLGERVITPDAFERGVEALARFKAAADTLEVDDIHAAATSAVREARNGDAFCRAVKERTGVHIRVISGSDEGRLIYLGARGDLDFSRGRVMLCDLGGGSTELVLCEPDAARLVVSLPLGHIRLADAFHGSDPLSADDRKAMKAAIREALRPLVRRVPKSEVGALVGTSGTVRVLARMATAARGEPLLEHAQGLVLTRRELEGLIDRFMDTPAAALDRLPGMDPRRRRTLPAGAVLLREIMKATGVSELTTSERSLRDGLIADWMLRHRPEVDLARTVTDPRRRSVLLTMDRFGADPAHAEHVASLSLTLFDQTVALHLLPLTDRDLLRDAALLHDIGHHISGSGHHRHGQYLLRHIRLYGFTAPEVAVMSNVVRYHARSVPKLRHPEFAALTPEDQRRVRVLAGLLRIADGLDRSHNQPVTRLTAAVRGGVLRVDAWVREGGELEQWAAARRASVLSEALGMPVTITVRLDPDAAREEPDGDPTTAEIADDSAGRGAHKGAVRSPAAP